MPHHCPIKNCFAEIKPWALLCVSHWRLVPPDLQRDVTHANRFFKGKGIHLRACRRAIEHVVATIRASEPPSQTPQRGMPYRDD